MPVELPGGLVRLRRPVHHQRSLHRDRRFTRQLTGRRHQLQRQLSCRQNLQLPDRELPRAGRTAAAGRLQSGTAGQGHACAADTGRAAAARYRHAASPTATGWRDTATASDGRPATAAATVRYRHAAAAASADGRRNAAAAASHRRASGGTSSRQGAHGTAGRIARRIHSTDRRSTTAGNRHCRFPVRCERCAERNPCRRWRSRVHDLPATGFEARSFAHRHSA